MDTEEDAADMEDGEDSGDVMEAAAGGSASESEQLTATGDTGGAFLTSLRKKKVTLLMTLVTTSAKILRSMKREEQSLPYPR